VWQILCELEELCEVEHIALHGDIVLIIADVFVLPPKLAHAGRNGG
jgi:hypothetical protein